MIHNNHTYILQRYLVWAVVVTPFTEIAPVDTAVVKNVVGKHYFLAVFGPIDAHFSSQPLRQPHGMTISHIVKLNHTVIKKELKLG